MSRHNKKRWEGDKYIQIVSKEGTDGEIDKMIRREKGGNWVQFM